MAKRDVFAVEWWITNLGRLCFNTVAMAVIRSIGAVSAAVVRGVGEDADDRVRRAAGWRAPQGSRTAGECIAQLGGERNAGDDDGVAPERCPGENEWHGSRLLWMQAQRVDLDQGDPLLGEADADGRLTDGQADDLVRGDQERLPATQQAAGEGTGWSELDLAHDFGAAARAERSGHGLGVFGCADLMDAQDAGTEQRLAEHRLLRQLLG